MGWVAMEPRPAYRRIVNHGIGGEDASDDGVWVVSCFVVRVGHRRKGAAHGLLEAAVAHARAHGARVVEAFPIIPGPGVSSADLYHGPVSVFESAGFEVVARPSDRRAVVRLTL
jgi:GNAT superfamily N-acetyltransferase